MFWSILSFVACLVLVTKLILWSDEHRRESRWYYRVLMFLVAVYLGNEVIQFFYEPLGTQSPWVSLFHLALLTGAFVIKPQYLPWNTPYDPANPASKNHRHGDHPVRDAIDRLRVRMGSSCLRRGKAATEERKFGVVEGPRRIH